MPNCRYFAEVGRRSHRRALLRWFVFVWILGSSVGTTGVPAPQISGDEVLQSLERTVDWYRRVSALNQAAENAQEMTLRNALRHASQQALHLGFDFARAEAAMLGNEPSVTPATGPAA